MNEIIYDTTLLQNRVNEFGYMRKDLAEKLGISRQLFNSKLHGRVRFTITEALILSKTLRIPVSKMGDYFT